MSNARQGNKSIPTYGVEMRILSPKAFKFFPMVQNGRQIFKLEENSVSKKVQYDNSFGLDLSQVVAWRRIPISPGSALLTEEDRDLEVYISGSTIRVEKSTLGAENFDNLLQSLVEQFSPRLPPLVDERMTTVIKD
jgi:hypothetical protein